jgi:hypothetical protein
MLRSTHGEIRRSVSVVEAYLREAFPGASVHRIHRVGDAYQEGIRPHDKGGEMWRAETPERDYDFAITDEALEDLPAETLGAGCHAPGCVSNSHAAIRGAVAYVAQGERKPGRPSKNNPPGGLSRDEIADKYGCGPKACSNLHPS